MKLFNIYIKKSENDSIDDLALVKSNFSYTAFIFNFLWFLQHRMWKESGSAIVVFAVFIAIAQKGFFSAFDIFLIWIGWAMIIGLNAGYWYEQKLINKGYVFYGNVFGKNKDEAKLRFISNCFKDKEHQIFSSSITNLEQALDKTSFKYFN